MATPDWPAEWPWKALSFVAGKHHRHRRGLAHDPVPPAHHHEVLRLIGEIGRITDRAIRDAAVLHDVLELTMTTRDELRQEFGEQACGLVQELTVAGDHEPGERRRQQLERAPRLSPAAQVIRLADALATLDASQELDRADQRELANWGQQMAFTLRAACPSSSTKCGR